MSASWDIRQWLDNQPHTAECRCRECFRPEPPVPAPSTPELGDLEDAVWARRLERVCPACGIRSIGDGGICQTCGSTKGAADTASAPRQPNCRAIGAGKQA